MAEKYTEEMKGMLRQVARQLAKEGQLVDHGWRQVSNALLPPDASDYQIHDVKAAFFVGVWFLTTSIEAMFFEDASGPSAREQEREFLRGLHKEIKAFSKEDIFNVMGTKGSA